MRAIVVALLVFLACAAPATRPVDSSDRLSFQTSPGWSPRVNLNANVALVYGIGRNLPPRMESWREHGYHVQVMTGVAWGQYQDYLYGRFDGKKHDDEIQTDAGGTRIGHGGDVFYMSPGDDYARYLCTGIERALDAGAEAICLEEPEFWVKGGWEQNFHRQWKAEYHEEWQPPDSSAEAQYRASKLKYLLYRRTLSQIFEFVHRWAKEHGRQIPCYVATHSLLNYAHWHIVSPESSLIDVGCDGYIAQVWTGTARTPNMYEGVLRERTFETAFLEYGAMQNLVRASHRLVWYLNDPVEDNPRHTWLDYRTNWQNTLTASLFQPEVWRYEVMPWPQRVFGGRHPLDGSGQRVPIPKDYETELQAVIFALGQMQQPPEAVRWEASGTRGVGVLVSDTMMFQRGGPLASDEHLGSFYGLAMPLLARGMPVEPVQIESAAQPHFLDRYKLLLLTYEGQKPPSPAFHSALAKWVRQGGALVVIDNDKDPFNQVREWWNNGELAFETPRQHLFKELDLPAEGEGMWHVGKGVVALESGSPAGLTYQKDGADRVRELARNTAGAIGLRWTESSALVLRRGPYLIAAGLDESAPGAAPVTLHGKFISLFDGGLPVVSEVKLAPSSRAFLLDLDALPRNKEGVIGAACRMRDQIVTPHSIAFNVDGVAQSQGVVCVALLAAPQSMTIDGKPMPKDSYEFSSGILRLRFINSADSLHLEIRR